MPFQTLHTVRVILDNTRTLVGSITYFVLTILCFVGCTKHSAEQGTVPAGNKYATGFLLTETDSSVIVEVFQPYQRMEITEPLQRLGTMSTVQVGFLYALNAINYLAAVCNPELIYTPVKGTETDLGDSMKPSSERVLQAGLDALLAVNYGHQRVAGRFAARTGRMDPRLGRAYGQIARSRFYLLLCGAKIPAVI